MKNKSWESISLKIKDVMSEKEISQKQLAEKCGTNQGSISRKLSNKDVNYSTAVSICDALDVDLKELF